MTLMQGYVSLLQALEPSEQETPALLVKLVNLFGPGASTATEMEFRLEHVCENRELLMASLLRDSMTRGLPVGITYDRSRANAIQEVALGVGTIPTAQTVSIDGFVIAIEENIFDLTARVTVRIPTYGTQVGEERTLRISAAHTHAQHILPVARQAMLESFPVTVLFDEQGTIWSLRTRTSRFVQDSLVNAATGTVKGTVRELTLVSLGLGLEAVDITDLALVRILAADAPPVAAETCYLPFQRPHTTTTSSLWYLLHQSLDQKTTVTVGYTTLPTPAEFFAPGLTFPDELKLIFQVGVGSLETGLPQPVD
jgi:hypothetical protein